VGSPAKNVYSDLAFPLSAMLSTPGHLVRRLLPEIDILLDLIVALLLVAPEYTFDSCCRGGADGLFREAFEQCADTKGASEATRRAWTAVGNGKREADSGPKDSDRPWGRRAKSSWITRHRINNVCANIILKMSRQNDVLKYANV
jgi:hypothetical protein